MVDEMKTGKLAVQQMLDQLEVQSNLLLRNIHIQNLDVSRH